MARFAEHVPLELVAAVPRHEGLHGVAVDDDQARREHDLPHVLRGAAS